MCPGWSARDPVAQEIQDAYPWFERGQLSALYGTEEATPTLRDGLDAFAHEMAVMRAEYARSSSRGER